MAGRKIPTSYARQLVKNYRDQKLGRPLKSADTQSVWFSKETILQALNMVAPIDPTLDVSGLRIYIGAYESTVVQPDINRKGKLTLILVQTRATGLKHNDILEKKDALPGYEEAAGILGEFDDGQLCPPPNYDENGSLLDPNYV
ncbi:MAG: hypothetical protein J0L56_17655 [Chitinophagales bacterium]|nr:hypothetical protein [Chitinophagales bacterium]